ncbi:MAG: hypothetical protein IPM46_02380 [Flavobacteriales bacterium]|nr:hypothetical protein [Flavobacteriales bacterium]
MTSTVPIVPSYRALTIAGNVLERDEAGEVHHAIVVDTTLAEEVVVVYELH